MLFRSLFLTKPSDLGYDDTGYDLPEMEIIYHKVKVDHSTAGADRDGQFKLFRDAAIGLKDAAKEKRDSILHRVEIINKILLLLIEENNKSIEEFQNDRTREERKEKGEIGRAHV